MVMNKKRYSVKTKGRMFVIFIFFSAIVVTLSFTFLHNLSRIDNMNKQLNRMKFDKERLIEEQESIEADIKRLSDPEYIARYVREKYFYSKENELILRIKNKKGDS